MCTNIILPFILIKTFFFLGQRIYDYWLVYVAKILVYIYTQHLKATNYCFMTIILNTSPL